MYDSDYQEFLKEQANEGRFTTRDSGSRAEHSDGVIRDTQEGKTKFTLMFPEGVPMEDQLIVRLAELYTRGGEKYGDRNWENSNSEETLAHHQEALWRHFMNFYFNVQDGEDHAAAVVWNINAVELTRRKIRDQAFKEYVDVSQEIAATPTKPAKPLYDRDGDAWLFNPAIGKWQPGANDDEDGLSFGQLLKEWGPLNTSRGEG